MAASRAPMARPDKGPPGKSSATLGLAGGKLCFVRDTSAASEAASESSTGSAESGPAMTEKTATTGGIVISSDVSMNSGTSDDSAGPLRPRSNRDGQEDNGEVINNLRTRRAAASGKKSPATTLRKRKAKLRLPSSSSSLRSKATCLESERQTCVVTVEAPPSGSAEPPKEIAVDSDGLVAAEGGVDTDVCSSVPGDVSSSHARNDGGGACGTGRIGDGCNVSAGGGGDAHVVSPVDATKVDKGHTDGYHERAAAAAAEADSLGEGMPKVSPLAAAMAIATPAGAGVLDAAGGSSSGEVMQGSVDISGDKGLGVSPHDIVRKEEMKGGVRAGSQEMDNVGADVEVTDCDGEKEAATAAAAAAAAVVVAASPGVSKGPPTEMATTATTITTVVCAASLVPSPGLGSRSSKRLAAANAKAKAKAEAEAEAETEAAALPATGEAKATGELKKRQSTSRRKGSAAAGAGGAGSPGERKTKNDLTEDVAVVSVSDPGQESERSADGVPCGSQGTLPADAPGPGPTPLREASSAACDGGVGVVEVSLEEKPQPANVASIFLPRAGRKGGKVASSATSVHRGSCDAPSGKLASFQGGGALSTRGTGVSKGKAGKGRGKVRGRERSPNISANSKLVGGVAGIVGNVGDVGRRDEDGCGGSDSEVLGSGVVSWKVGLVSGEELAPKNTEAREIEVMEIKDSDDGNDEATEIEVRPEAPATDENVAVVRVTGALAKEMTDEELLSTVDMFLTKEQRLRKRAVKEDRLKERENIDTTQKILSERARRDAWAHNAVIGAPGGDQGGGDGGAKRPRVMASIFGKPARAANSAGRGSADRGIWREMPAPFPASSHVAAPSPIEVDDDSEGCKVEVGDCRACVDEGARVFQLLAEVSPGGLPPLPMIASASGSSHECGCTWECGCGSGSKNRRRCGAGASEREAETWRDAAEKAAGSVRRGSKPTISSSTVVDHRANGASAEERESLPSPAAMLFASPREGFGSGCSVSGPVAASLSREFVPERGILDARPDDDAGRNSHEVGDWNGAMTVIPRAKRERMMKIAAARRKEDAAADTLWTELYRPKSPDEVCGNAHVVDALSRWLGEWKERRGRPGNEVKRSPGLGGNSGFDSEYEWVRFSDGEDDQAESRLCNMAMICGPTGVGKTSTVYGCANALGYEVIEVNPSQLRSGSAIRRLFGEATQSHHVSSAESNQPRGGVDTVSERGAAGFFSSERGGRGGSARGKGGGKGRGKGKGSGGKNPGGGQGRKRPLLVEGDEIVQVKAVTSVKLSLILFEEVDVIFEEDVGFLSALRDLRRGAKCPVILTAESYRRDFAQLSCDILYMPRPRLVELEACLVAVAAAEGLDVSSSALRSLAQFHSGDLRACLLTLQACKGRGNRCRRAEEGISSTEQENGRESSDERPKVKGRRTTSDRRRRLRLGKGASPEKRSEEQFKERSGKRYSAPCWRRLASHVEADYAVAHDLAFDTFLPALAEDLSARLAAPTSAVAALAGSTKDGSSATSRFSSSNGGRERLAAVAVSGGDESGVAEASIPGFLGSGLPHEALWEPPFLRRWPEVLAVSPSSVPAEACPLSTKSASLFRAKPGGLLAGGERGTVKDTSGDGADARRRALGHRVLITGRYFAHSVGGERRETCRVPSLDKNTVGLENPPLQRSSHLEEGITILGRGEEQAVAQSTSCGMREVFVQFGEAEVHGTVISDSLVEAFAPPSYRPGFVEVSVAVKGGIGGDLVSNAPVSGATKSKRFSAVLFRYCAPPPPFPPIVGVKHGMSGIVKTKGRGKRRKSATRGKDGLENGLENGSENAPENGAMSPVVVYGRYGPILMDDGDDVVQPCNGDGRGENPDRSDDEVGALSTSRISTRKSKRRFAVSEDDEEDDDEERIVDRQEEGAGVSPRDIGGGFNTCGTEHGETPPSESASCGPADCETGAHESPAKCMAPGETPGKKGHGEVHGENEPLETPCETFCEMEVETPREMAGETEHDVLGQGRAAAVATASASGGHSILEMTAVDDEKENPSPTGKKLEEAAFKGPGETVSVPPKPYDLPTPAEADWQRGLGALLEATSALADTFSAADVIGGVSLARGWDGAASPFAEGGDHVLTVGGSSWVEKDPRVSQGFLEDEVVAGPCISADGLPRTLWDGTRDWYQSVCRRKGDESARYFLSRPRAVTAHGSPEILEYRYPEKLVIADGANCSKGNDVQAMGLRGRCLAYCQRDRADFISSGSALATRPLRARGSTALPDALTLDLAPALSQLCAIEEDRQAESGMIDTGGRRGGRFRHYLVRTGVVGNYREAERIARIYKESAW